MHNRPIVALFAVLLVLFSCTLAHGQPSEKSLLDRKIPYFEETDAEAERVFERFAKRNKIPLGMEYMALASGTREGKRISVKIEKATVRDVLNAIMQADPRYEWVEADGVINVFPKQHKNPLLEVVVNEFQANQERADFAVIALTELPEVKLMLEKLGLRRRFAVDAQDRPEFFPHPFSIYKATVRQVLNRLMKESENYYWMFTVYGDRNEYFHISISPAFVIP